MLVRNVSNEPRLVLLQEHEPTVVAPGSVVLVSTSGGEALLVSEPGVWVEEHALVPPAPDPSATPP